MKVNNSDEPALRERQRDIFPLLLLCIDVSDTIHLSCDDAGASIPIDLIVRAASLFVHALNSLSGFVAPSARPGQCAPQRAAQRRALDQAKKWLASIINCTPPGSSVALGRLIHDEDLSGVKTARPSLDAARCDLLERSGEVDPLRHITHEYQDTKIWHGCAPGALPETIGASMLNWSYDSCAAIRFV